MAGKAKDVLAQLEAQLAKTTTKGQSIAQQQDENASKQRDLQRQIRKLHDERARTETLARQAAIGQALDEAALVYATLDDLVLYAQVGLLACAAGLGQFDAETLSQAFPRMVEHLRQCGGDPGELEPQVYVIEGGKRGEV